MEATAEKSTLAEQRTQKKATRRAAFIQDVAEAVAAKVCDSGTKGSPFAQACYEQGMADWQAGKMREAELDGLHWAIQKGLLPEGTIKLPSEDTQRQLLATLADKGDAAA